MIASRSYALRASALGLLGLLLFGMVAAGCTPTCEQACRRLSRCDLDADNLTRDECEIACLTQEALYEEGKDDVRLDALRAHRACLGASTCDEIEAGVCYDAEIYPF